MWVPERALPPLTCYFAADGARLDPPMALQLIYQMFSELLGWTVLRGSSDIEILVLGHHSALLRRRPPRPRMNGTDRALIAALARLLSACRAAASNRRGG